MTRRILMCLCALAALAQAKPNLSGEWAMNTEKSDFGPFPAPSRFVRKVEHADPNLKSVTTQTGRRGEITTELNYTTDGKECTNLIAGNDVKGTAKWDGDTLVIESRREIQGSTVTFQEKWTLSGGGKTLTIASHISSRQGEVDVRIVLDKQ